MPRAIVPSQSPEEEELERTLAELSTLEEELAERELDLATLNREFNLFERRYIKIVGVLYARLDELEAQLAEVRASLDEDEPQSQQSATEARARAQDSARATSGIDESPLNTPLQPSTELKKLYREVARTVHPDFSVDDAERKRRTSLMVEANRAYEEGDEARLEAILQQWEKSPESVQGQGIAADLARVVRKIDQIRDRLQKIESAIMDLESSEMWSLKVKVEEATSAGRNLLEEMATALDEQIASKGAELAAMNRDENSENE